MTNKPMLSVEREEFESAISAETGLPVEVFEQDRVGNTYHAVGPKYAWWGWARQESRKVWKFKRAAPINYGAIDPAQRLALCRGEKGILTDKQILEAMRPSITDADGGYIIDTAPENVVAAGRALLEAAKLNGVKP